MARWVVYEADRSGNSWETYVTDSPAEAVAIYKAHRGARPHNSHGVIDIDDPERGDVQAELEESLRPKTTFDQFLSRCVSDCVNARR